MRSVIFVTAALVCAFYGGAWLVGIQADIEAKAAEEYRQQLTDLRDYIERRDRVAWEPREGYAPWYSADGERVVLWRWVPGGVR